MTGEVDVMRDHLRHLQELASGLGGAVTVDEVARASLTAVLAVPSLIRAGFAVSEAAGREFRFASTDQDALTPLGVRWCTVDALSDLPLADAIRTGQEQWLTDLPSVGRRYPHLLDRQRSLGTRSLATLPLDAAGTVLGALMLSFEDEQPFGED